MTQNIDCNKLDAYLADEGYQVFRNAAREGRARPR
jgi:hypothetical protein